MSGADTGLRVALVNPTFWPEVQRGTERIVGMLAADLAAAGHSPRVITSHRGRPGTSHEFGFPVTRVWRPPGEGLLQMRGFQQHMTHLPLTGVALARGEEQLAHAFYATDVVAALEAGRGRRPTVFSYMGIPQREVLSGRRLRLPFIRRAVTEADAVISLSKAAARGLERWLGVSSQVIYPAVDLDDFSPGGTKAESPTVVCAASPDDPRKRVDLLARAFARVRRERPGARLRLMRPTDPGLAGELESLSEGIEFFAPAIDGVVEEYRSAWLSVLPSYNEAFGLVLTESLACGTPVVATHDGGVPEIVDRPEVGALIGPDEGEEALARAILETLDLGGDPGTQAACRERARGFGRAPALHAHEGLYRRLIAEAGA